MEGPKMRVKLISAPERACYETMIARLKQCCSNIDAYLGMAENNEQRQKLLKEITDTVPRGIYRHGCGTSADPIFVEGVHRKRGKRSREQAFCVRYAGLLTFTGKDAVPASLLEMPLIDTEGFLVPVFRDGYRGARFVRIADLSR